MTASIWEFERHDWSYFDGYGDVGAVPVALNLLLHADKESEWNGALQNLEAIASDCGVPSSVTPAVVGCLASAVLRVGGGKRVAIVSSLEELTCGRGREIYNSQQQTWLEESVRELLLNFDSWLLILEEGVLEEVRDCMALLAYCAELQRSLAVRVEFYLSRGVGRFPSLEEEARSLAHFFRAQG